jgi:hypothetical protein
MKKRSVVDFTALTSFLESVQSYTEDLIFGVVPGQALYHYTDLSGLQGILQHDDLWLTHSRYLNDDEEITHGYRIVKEVIEEQRAGATPDRLQFLDGLFELVKEPSEEGVYICSFCLDDNLLSQWRGYGANGMGVSLKFDPSGFSYITGPDSPKNGLMRLWKVFYPAATQKNIIAEAIRFALSYGAADRTPQERASQAADAIQFFIPTFKNEGFIEEKECRLIFTPSPDFSGHPRFRVARGMLIPYYSLKELTGSAYAQRKLPLTGIRVGPSANKRLNVESTKMVLAQTAYPVEVESSQTSFRGT